MTVILKSITIKNFLSIGNVAQGIDFDRRDLVLVLGENLDVGGEGARNGVGKSTLISALCYALYGTALSDIKKENLINKSNEKGMLVSLDFSKDGIDYKIERGRKPNVLKFWKGDITSDATDDAQGENKETQRDIDKTIGMSCEMFKHIVVLSSYTEPFLNLKANDQRAIIEQLLGITLLSEKAEVLKDLLRGVKDGIQQEEANIKAVTEANARINEQIASTKRREKMWLEKHEADCAKLREALDSLLGLDIDAEVALHKATAAFNQTESESIALSTEITRLSKLVAKEEKAQEKVTGEIALLQDHKCHSCGQDVHDDTHAALLTAKTTLLNETVAELGELRASALELQEALATIVLPAKPAKTFYPTEADAVHHRTTVGNLQAQLASKVAEENPYADQITEMSTKALADINYDKLNGLIRLKDHQELLLKLLTNKDSFIRKRIIDQNLSYLNARLDQYLTRIGLPHTVVFQNDLTVSITELGRDLDFGNLSRGEGTRLVLSLSFAFRDVWESLYQPINLLFIDEMIDAGLDSRGVDDTLAILKKMARDNDKSVWLISHRDELVSRVTSVLKVVKENGFTSIGFDLE